MAAIDAAGARTVLGVDAAGADNSTPVTIAPGSFSYATLSGQALTLHAINAATDLVGIVPPANLGTGSGGATKFLREDGTWQTVAGGGGGGGDALTTDPLSQFAATTSDQLRGVISDETGTGALVFASSPTFVTPLLGTPAGGTLTNCTGLPAAGVVGLTTVATDVIFDAAGDLVVGTGANTAARLAIGATGNILRSNGTTAAWSALAAADIAISDAGSHFTGVDVEAALQELGAGGLRALTYYFGAAGTYLIANGPATAYSIFLTSSDTGTLRIYDNTEASGPDVLGSTVTAPGAGVPIPIGTAPTYGAANTGLYLVVVGANAGYVTWSA
jgi:hypothetical protein